MAAKYKSCDNNKAFTLVELSIVIVIIGLIIAGVSEGKNLVASSKLRKTASDINQIVSAINAFKIQYSAYPGDIKNFRSFFSACKYPDWDANACNGDGDGKIGSCMATRYENIRVYMHLNYAGLYPGNFDGISDASGGCGIAAHNTPFAPINGGNKLAYTFYRWNTAGVTNASVAMGLGQPRLTQDGNYLKPYDGATTATQMQYLDTKLDDGNGAWGKLKAYNGSASPHNCLNGTDYNTQYTNELNCLAFYVIKP